MWLAIMLVVGHAYTFSFDDSETCDAFMRLNVEYWVESQQVPSIVMCMPVKVI